MQNVRSPISEVQSIVTALHCVRTKGVVFLQTRNPALWYALPPPLRSNINTLPISACDISKERKQISAQIYNLLFLSRGRYTLRVIIVLIYCIVTLFAHCS